MCSLKVPTTAIWTNGSYHGPATLFKTMETQYGSIGKMDVSNDTSESGRNPDNNESEFCGGRSSVNFYRLKQKRNSISLQ